MNAPTCGGCSHYVPATGRCLGAALIRRDRAGALVEHYQPKARSARTADGTCGPLAHAFEPIHPAPWWRRLLRRLHS